MGQLGRTRIEQLGHVAVLVLRVAQVVRLPQVGRVHARAAVLLLQVLLGAPLLARVAPRARLGHAGRDDRRPRGRVARLGHRDVDAVEHVVDALAGDLRGPAGVWA
jgi:hypothetical protein